MKKTLPLFVFVFAMLFAYSIYGQNFIQVTKSNEGQTINLPTGKVLEVNLPRKASTGYIWCESISYTDKTIQPSIKQIGDGDFTLDPSSITLNGKRMVGQSGTQIIRYIGNSQGTTVLTLELKRPWEKNNLAIDNFTITVVSSGKYTGNYIPYIKEKPKHVTSTPKSVPSRWDWRSQCTPITNQGNCGDCWAFASVATLECNIKIIDGVTRDISEEFVTDCYTNGGCSGCQGGYCAHEAWLSSYTGANSQGGGAVYESEDATTCPNTGNTGSCGGSYVPHETISSYADVAGEDGNGIPPDANMKDAIYNYGPIWICIDAASNAFSNYSGGIYTESGSQTDHAVALVGWVDSAAVSGGGYWILRNSWGSSWGINGYMYISYGSDLVGTWADYIVYKGGIPHAVPPVANFGAAATSSCSGVIQFTDSSTNVPTSWLWDFGDGTTSTLQNPSHAYNTSGTFTIVLIATNSYGNNTKTKTSYITINLATSPTVTSASRCDAGSVTLSASGTGTLSWYDAASGGNLVYTGTSFATPSLSATTTYYVQSTVSQPVQPAGMIAKTANGSYFNNSGSDWSLIFDALSPITIKSVTVYASGAANRTIWLKNSSGTTINSVVVNIPNGQQSVTLNFNIPTGTGYELGTYGTCNLWRESSGAAFPYTTAGLVSITGNTASAMDHYYYFYNWQVQPVSCLSALIPVVATINLNVTSSVSISANPSGAISSGTSVTFTATPVNGGTTPTYQWQNNGTNIPGETNPTYTTTTLTNNDVITCIMTSNADCIIGSPVTSNAIYALITGIEEEPETAFEIFPNPNQGIFNIQYDNKVFNEATVFLFNTLGEKLIEKKLVNHIVLQIDASSFSRGIYFMKLQTNKSTYIRKVFIDK